MTVSELMQALAALPPDSPVLLVNEEYGGYHDAALPRRITVQLTAVHPDLREGPHVACKPGENGVQAVVIGC